VDGLVNELQYSFMEVKIYVQISVRKNLDHHRGLNTRGFPRVIARDGVDERQVSRKFTFMVSFEWSELSSVAPATQRLS